MNQLNTRQPAWGPTLKVAQMDEQNTTFPQHFPHIFVVLPLFWL